VFSNGFLTAYGIRIDERLGQGTRSEACGHLIQWRRNQIHQLGEELCCMIGCWCCSSATSSLEKNYSGETLSQPSRYSVSFKYLKYIAPENFSTAFSFYDS